MRRARIQEVAQALEDKGMDSFLAWMDYSEHDRRRALDVIDLFKEKDTRDELGVGAVRDAVPAGRRRQD